ncbi:MAG: T9SS type A sorting domain-containing protein [Ignavibacteria bacterium]|nr:T9SS type A sorting domain-containing protein [Ignavibacteria bacterium]
MRLLLLVVFLYAAPLFAQDVVINKYRNGGDNLIDTVEVLVVRDNFDLRGYILRDFATSGGFNSDSVSMGSGSYRFANSQFWQRIPAGTLLVLPVSNVSVQKLGDTVVTVGLDNSVYFTKSGAFDIATADMVMIKRPGATISGTSGSVHALSAGLSIATVSGITPLLRTSDNTGTATPYALPDNPRGDTTDYNGNRAGTVAQARFGLANNPANQRFLDSLRRLRAPLTSVQHEKQLALTNVRIAPAPINNDCTVGFQMNASGTVEISLVDMRGHARHLTTAYHAAGEQSVRVSVGDVAQGIYFLVVKTGGGEWREKVLVVR